MLNYNNHLLHCGITYDMYNTINNNYFQEQKWDFFLDNGGANWSSNSEVYLRTMKKLCRVDTVQSFWTYMNGMEKNLLKICTQPNPTFTLRMFRSDIRPIWEDKANKHGGKWVVTCSKLDPTVIWGIWQELYLFDAICL